MTAPLTLSTSTSPTPEELNEIYARIAKLSPSLTSSLHLTTTQHISDLLHVSRDLLCTLPSTLEEVRVRSKSYSLFDLRMALFILIDQDLLNVEEGDQLAPLFRVLGVGELEELLEKWLKNERTNPGAHLRRNRYRQERGLASLFHSARGHLVFDQMSELERIELSGPWVRPMLRLARRDAFPRHALRALYRATSQEARPELIHHLERLRSKVSAPLIPTYCELLLELDLPDLDLLFHHLVINNELGQIEPYLNDLPSSIKRAFDYAVCSLSAVS